MNEGASRVAAAVAVHLPAQVSEWAHEGERWSIAQRAARDILHADVHDEYGLVFGISNHETLVLCRGAAYGERVEDTEDHEVTTSLIDDVPEMIEGVEFLDTEDPASFLCHSEWPVCIQGSRLYVFAEGRLARIDEQLDFDLPAYEPADRAYILREIEARTHLSRDTCSNAARALSGSFVEAHPPR